MANSTRDMLIRLEERVKDIQKDVSEIKTNGHDTKKRIRTLEDTTAKHATYFKSIPFVFGLVGTLAGLAWTIYRFVI